ncbi:MAG: hypothetical protein RL215_333, partial [Planctomycetota bacterium]
MEGERDEGLEAFGFVLQVSESQEVVDAMSGFFDVSVEHGGIGAESELVGGAMNIEPDIAVGFVFADLATDLLVEDFCSAPGHAPESRFDHLFEDPADGFFGDEGEPVDFDGSPGLDVNFRAGFVDDADDVEVPVEVFFVVESTDDVDFGGAASSAFEDAFAEHVICEGVGFVVAEIGAEGAEAAAVDADVGGVQVDVGVVVGVVAVLAFADEVGELSECLEVGVFIEEEAVFEVESLAGQDAVDDELDLGIGGGDG